MEQDEIFDSPFARTQTAIRELFVELGAVSIRSLAETALDRGLIDDETRHACELHGLAGLCRRTLKTKTATGLPFAKPLGDEDGAWSQLRLFNREQLFALIRREAAALTSDHDELVKLADYCRERFGDAPEIPALVVAEPVGAGR